MFKRIILGLLPVAVLLVLPLYLRPAAEKTSGASPEDGKREKLVLITPHTEPIKYEFERGFRRYYREKYGTEIELDWRNVGGTSDIVRYINDRYEAAFRQNYERGGGAWSDKIAEAFRNGRLDRGVGDAEALHARKMFLQSDTGIGIDLFFGGGTYDHARFAGMGYLTDPGVRRKHPEWFYPEIMPEQHAGEVIYDHGGKFYGACLSTFGIAYNTDRMRDDPDLPEIRGWKDLTAPGFYRKTAVADPTKSGSITKCFEMILQQAIAEAVAAAPDDQGAVARGWQDGFLRIKLIAANSRLMTDSAGTLVRNISSGTATAGMCIDFYGLSEAQWTNQMSGGERIRYVMPANGTAISADPIAMLRGAPNARAARAFIEYTLSPDGQKLWFLKPGTPGGPEKYALRRPPVRRDLFADETLKKWRSDPDYDPYSQTGTFRYHGEWTGRYFNLIRVLIKTLVLDPCEDLQEAWGAVLENGGPENNPEAMALLSELPFAYAQCGEMSNGLWTSEKISAADVAALRRSWSDYAGIKYRAAKEAARRTGKNQRKEAVR